MVGFLEIAIFLFATSVNNGQALAHWVRAIANFIHHIHCWIEFLDWIGFIWQAIQIIGMYINRNILSPFCLLQKRKTCNNNLYYTYKTHLFAPLYSLLNDFIFSLGQTIYCLIYLISTIMCFFPFKCLSACIYLPPKNSVLSLTRFANSRTIIMNNNIL